jgi:cell division protein FtsB
MGPKYKVTGCARFFLFLVLFVPAVFFGAAYFRGENGVQIIKDFYYSIVGGGSSTEEAKEKAKAEEKAEDEAKEESKDKEIDRLKREIEEKDKEIEKLKSGEK